MRTLAAGHFKTIINLNRISTSCPRAPRVVRIEIYCPIDQTGWNRMSDRVDWRRLYSWFPPRPHVSRTMVANSQLPNRALDFTSNQVCAPLDE